MSLYAEVFIFSVKQAHPWGFCDFSSSSLSLRLPNVMASWSTDIFRCFCSNLRTVLLAEAILRARVIGVTCIVSTGELFWGRTSKLKLERSRGLFLQEHLSSVLKIILVFDDS